MSLSRIGLLNEEQLLKAIKESGHEEIANILRNRGLNGQSFLECQELQTVRWRLSRAQTKSIFDFIDKVKANPAILLNSQSKVRQLKSKPAQPPIPKPSNVVTPKPIIHVRSKPSSIIDKPLVFTKPQFTAGSSVSSKNIDGTREQTEFKKKLGVVLGNVRSSSPSRNSNFTSTQSTEPIQQVDLTRKPDRSKVNKQFLPEPLRRTTIKNRPACPLPIGDLVKSPLDDYLTPNDIDISYPVPAAENSFNSTPATSFLHDKFSSQFHDDVDDDVDSPEDAYETPPSFESASIPSKQLPLPTAAAGISPIMNRRPLPLPIDEKGTQRNSLSSISNPVGSEDEDDEEKPNIYSDVDELPSTNNITKYRGPQGSLQKDSQRSPNVVPKKCTINDLDNVLIVDKDKRRSNFLGSLGNIGKFIVEKYKTKQENYENHMLQTEISSISTTSYSFKDRPLPKIPTVVTTDEVIKNSTTLDEIIPVGTRGKETSPKSSKSLSTNKIDGGSIRKQISADLFNKPLPDIPHDDNDDDEDEGLLYENLDDKKTKDELDQPEYENNENLRRSPSKTIKNKQLPNLRDSLAYKLSEALKARESDIKKGVLKKPNFNKLPTSEPSVEENQSLYGNVEETDQLNEEEDTDEEQKDYIDSIFNINHEPFYRNTDRKGAKKLLFNLTDGAFLFRPSERYFLVLTIKFKGKYHNLGIERSNNKIRLIADTQSISPEFATIRAFVNYFSKEPVTFKDSTGNLIEIYLNPILPADIF